MMSSSLDKTIKLWKDLKCVHTFTEHNDWIRCLGISPSNNYLLSGCVSSVIKGWDLNTNKVIFSLSNPNPDQSFLNTVNSLAFQNYSEDIFLCGTTF
jgi:WD40 repeat protein